MRILIVGKNSYIGNHIDEWLTSKGHIVNQLDVLTQSWRDFHYSSYDAIVHVAAIVHRPDCKDWDLYQSVNADLPVEIASLAKRQGVKSFVYFSSMAVYGLDKMLSPNVIDEHTLLRPESLYGRSKLLAEEGLAKLRDDSFVVSIVRPPSVYGKGCRGGYISGFTKIARILPIIPVAYENVHQSFVYIDNLSECVRLIVENGLDGVFCPQDEETPNANRLLEVICNGIGKKFHSSQLIGAFLKLFSSLSIVKKAYGGIEYSRDLSTIPGFDYNVISFEEGMRRTVASI